MNILCFLHAALSGALDFLFPERCVLCGSFISSGCAAGRRSGPYSLCAACAESLPSPQEPRCRVCSSPLISEKDLCMGCRRDADSFHFESNVSVFVYQDPGVTELIVSYKGRKRRSLAAFLATRLLEVYRRNWDGFPVAPVPCRKASLKKRGFDQIALLCREMKKLGGVRILPLLRRGGKTREQKTLNREERAKNLLGSIQPSPRRGRYLKNGVPQSVVLLDDVFTTGATANACAVVLKELGVKKVYVLTLALD
ncbi:MAG: ComF family protein [Spirochaetales bacterium]|jgi:ComF family protein|nr:ComF family protein [Spirochaetales bacterium]